ncbi:helix-turn-helix domain-containing protein [Deinococcus sp. 6YEL10]|uniref:helix-turn-helix domain-containing protein n=1 Tax=Deinococcus sp. 6YEL10 TaxID=2745870 RepID=UPI00351D7E42
MAAQIRQARQNSGYSQEELAARANLSRSHISKIESAQYDPQFTTLLRLTTALKLSMQDLLRGNG